MNLILHGDEIFLKGSNQPFFYRCLISNLKDLFAGIKITRIESGFWLENFKEEETKRLALIPGIANFAPAIRCENTLAGLKKGIDSYLEENDNLTGETGFRITSERSFKKLPLSSSEIENEMGAYVQKKTGWKVVLNKSKLNIHIATGSRGAFIYGNTTDGAGGLPVGSSGKLLCLMSGGIDSPVAAYKMMCRGAEIGLIHFQNQTSVTAEVGQKIFDLAKVLSRYQASVRLFMVPFAGLQKQIVMNVPSTHRMIASRRIFFRIAADLAAQYGYQGLVTGDCVGQVASQTLENMAAVYDSVPMLKLAPLAGMNKKDIMNEAKKINTLEISNRPYEDCCSLFLSRHPETKTKPADIAGFEKNMDLQALDKKDIISYLISNN